MKGKVLATIAGGIALGAIALPASAQVSKPIGLSLRAGIGWPTDTSVVGSGTLFAAGLEFNLYSMTPQEAGIGASGHFTISGDYLGRSGGYALPILLNFVGTTQSSFFYTLGLGTEYVNRSGGHNVWGLGYRGGIGYNFSTGQTPIFLEADYFGNSNSHYNAVAVYVGVRL